MKQDKKKQEYDRESRFRVGSRAWLRDFFSPARAFGEIFLLSAAIFGLFCILCLIFIEANALGSLFVPTLLGYLALLTVAAGYLLRRKAKQHFRAEVGEEIYFETYPREYRRKLRKEAAEARREARRGENHPQN